MGAFETGLYSRERCLARMNADKAAGKERIDHCRACELAWALSTNLGFGGHNACVALRAAKEA